MEAPDGWCVERGIPKGDVLPIEQVWAFAVEWYSRRADAAWAKWSVREAAELFRRHNLMGPIWSLSDDAERF
jgi:hypothetical protein